MTAVQYRPSGRRPQVTPYTTERRIVGTPAEVASTVDRVRRSGRLVAMTYPRPMAEGDGRVFVKVRFLATPVRSTRQVTTDRRRAVLRAAGRAAAVVVPATGLAVAVVYAVSRLVAALLHLLPLLGVALVVTVIAWSLLGRAGVCPGLHCPGCSHGGHR
ncbi:hypothetical protein [Actinoplanes sp. NPDC049599]|uniref:hypothetical protein n=1 Tax=Actinoplanes sp. NPDC049599 TaxID=3363903 RepID=UPI00378894AA